MSAEKINNKSKGESEISTESEGDISFVTYKDIIMFILKNLTLLIISIIISVFLIFYLKNKKLKKNSCILAIHTGGLQGIDGMNRLLKKKDLPQINV